MNGIFLVFLMIFIFIITYYVALQIEYETIKYFEIPTSVLTIQDETSEWAKMQSKFGLIFFYLIPAIPAAFASGIIYRLPR